ncbi:MAG: ABC transporter ATP-binding protein [Oscillospiraceae bacterium]|nr:ABC transporter ATP-binding protein [Oscillospiraceae bacterium]
MAGRELVSVRGLFVQYNTATGLSKAVNGLSFELSAGETLGLVGETGAGKTTAALGIMGLIPSPPGKITGGEILFEGRSLLTLSKKEMREKRRRELSIIFQDPMTALNPVMTVGEQVSEAVRLRERLSRSRAAIRAAELLLEAGIPEDRLGEYPHQFSGGMRQRAVIAAALAGSPRLLIADEPTTALDLTIQAQVLSLMKRLRKQHGAAMLLITHDLGVVAEMCDRVAVMYGGKIVESGDTAAVFEKPAHPYTKGLFASLPGIGTKARRLTPIPGSAPDPARLPPGCAFHPRCPLASLDCAQVEPPYAEILPGHFARCYYSR